MYDHLETMILGEEVLGHPLSVSSDSIDSPKFSQVVVPFYIPNQPGEGFYCSTSSPTFGIVRLLQLPVWWVYNVRLPFYLNVFNFKEWS